MRAARQEMQEWRNWQTRRLQVPVVARSCGFKSHLLHYFFRFAYQELVRWTNSDCPDGKCENFPSGSFYFYAEKMCRRGKKNRRISDSVKLFKIIAIIHIFHKIKKIKIFSKKVLTFLEKTVIIYLVKRTTAKTTKECRSGGIGRRAGFRCLWSQDRVGSSPISCIIFSLCVSRIGPVDQFGLP